VIAKSDGENPVTSLLTFKALVLHLAYHKKSELLLSLQIKAKTLQRSKECIIPRAGGAVEAQIKMGALSI
jgi:hypothetical protein